MHGNSEKRGLKYVQKYTSASSCSLHPWIVIYLVMGILAALAVVDVQLIYEWGEFDADGNAIDGGHAFDRGGRGLARLAHKGCRHHTPRASCP